jgi:hypothetical protein
MYDGLDDSEDGNQDKICMHPANSSSVSLAISRPWTKEEDDRLRNAVKVLGEQKWTKMSQNIFSFSRTAQQCRQRWTKVLRPGIKKGAWSAEEDTQLRKAVLEALVHYHVNKIQWNVVAGKVPTRTYAMCRERWKNHLDPSVNHTEFSEAEQRKLEELHNHFGNQYANIATQMPGRTSEKIKAWVRAKTRLQNRKKAEKHSYLPPAKDSFVHRTGCFEAQHLQAESAAKSPSFEPEESRGTKEKMNPSDVALGVGDTGGAALECPRSFEDLLCLEVVEPMTVNHSRI